MRDRGIEMTLRKAVISDFKALNQLWNEAFESFGLGETTFDNLFYDLRITTLVFAEDEDVNGAILYIFHGGHCEILALLVHPAWHRQGVGSRLLKACFEAVHRHGALTVCLHTAETNRIARNFFEGHGFVATRKAERYPNEEVAIRYERRVAVNS